MNRATRDKFTAGTPRDLADPRAKWQTPPAIYADLALDFGPFDLDLTADATNHLEATWLGPGSTLSDDALGPEAWAKFGRRGYSNPPYGPFVPRMLARARAEARNGFTTVLLLPLRVTVAFRRHVLHGASDLLFCDKRICFYEDGHPRWNKRALRERGLHVPDSALFDSIVVVYRPGALARPRVDEWHVPAHAWPLERVA
jgi:DNA N-6-adenine-methyltransferase (Dam)